MIDSGAGLEEKGGTQKILAGENPYVLISLGDDKRPEGRLG